MNSSGIRSKLTLSQRPHVFRFAVSDSEGRYSCQWRVWTTKGKRPGDETYVAPRESGGKLKISLHSDGNSQIGLTEVVRNAVFATDRAALDRWHDDPSAGQIAFSILFHRSELRPGPTPAGDVTLVELAPHDEALCILIYIIDDDITAKTLDAPVEGIKVLSILARKSSGAVAVLAVPVSPTPELVRETKESLEGGSLSYWTLPVPVGVKQFAWGVTETHGMLEIAVDAAPPHGPQRALAGFSGSVHTWEELPLPTPNGLDVCAVLMIPDTGVASLYFNDHSRCDHQALLDDVSKLIDEFKPSGPDREWNRTPDDDGWATCLVTREAAGGWPSRN